MLFSVLRKLVVLFHLPNVMNTDGVQGPFIIPLETAYNREGTNREKLLICGFIITFFPNKKKL